MAPPRRVLMVLVGTSFLVSTTAVAASVAVTSARLATFTKAYGAPVTCTLGPAADAYVDQLVLNANTNFGTNVSLSVGATDLSLNRTFVRFDLAACSPTIPAGAIVRSATLRLVTRVAALSTRTYVTAPVIATWAEGTVTWNTQPGVAASPTASTTIPALTASGSTIEWNVIPSVQSFVTGDLTNHGWRLADSAENSGTATISFNSGEAPGGHPVLVITYVS